ncbi:hypothetical protein HPB51_028292 [Rhipicephalus microplus]|uniref:Uncharacterized protein n=1 Tax=Rhipicephalus microplus TaxID=6941 RepID=A0A9J6CXS1_RHIMP|nr:hypothetical protein HPB51_028292 [Rhipicephalus microplus]
MEQKQLARPKDAHNSTVYITAPAHQPSITRGNVPVAGRRTSNPKLLPVVGQDHEHAKHDGLLRLAQEQLRSGGHKARRSVAAQWPSSASLHKTVWFVDSPDDPQLNLPAGRHLYQPRSTPTSLVLHWIDGGMGRHRRDSQLASTKELSGREEMAEGAVVFVFVYMCVVVFAMAALLIYLYRSLTTAHPGVEMSTDETSTLSASKQLVVAEEHELGRGTSWTVRRPLENRRATATSREPKARGQGGTHSVDSTSTVTRTNYSEEGNVSRTSLEEDDEAGRATATVVTPDDYRRFLEFLVLAVPSHDERPSNWGYGNQELKGGGHLVRRGQRRRVG